MNHHQFEKLPHPHLVHWFFPSFGQMLPVAIREIVCVFISTLLLLALPAIVIVFYLSASEAGMSESIHIGLNYLWPNMDMGAHSLFESL